MRFKISFFFTICLLSTLVSCKNTNSKNEDNKHIKLVLAKKAEIGPFSRRLNPFARVDSIPSDLLGIPETDTVSVQMIRFFSQKKLNEMLADNIIDSTEHNNFKYGVYGVSGVAEGKQFFIVDSNNNKDFSDDERLNFDPQYRILAQKDKDLRDSVFPVLKLKYNDFRNGKIIVIEKFVRVFPYQDYFNFKNPTEEIKIYLKLHIVGQLTEHQEAFLNIDSLTYKLALQSDRGQNKILVAEKDKPYKPLKRGVYYRKYKLGDTLSLGTKYYSLDSLNPKLDELYLTSVKAPNLKYGYKAGDILADFKFETLKGNESSISQILKDKDYLLIDFWGTWCAPCLELTPNLIEIDKKSINTAILGIAYDFKEQPVIDYVNDKNIKWTQIYESRIRNDSLLNKKIVGQLKVETYPTYILIDKNRQIIHRGIGKDALKIITEIIQD